MNNDSISREALKEEFKRIYRYAETIEQLANNMEDAINNAPTVELTELCKSCKYLKDCETCAIRNWRNKNDVSKRLQ